VRRKDLYDTSASSSSDEEEELDRSALFAKIYAQLPGLFDLSSFAQPPPTLVESKSQSQAQSPDKSSAKKPLQQNDDDDDDADEVDDQDRDEEDEDENENERKKEGQNEAEEGKEAFTFRLFRDEAPTHTVVLTREDLDPSSASAQGKEGGFVVPSRPRSYYIAAPLTAEQESVYRTAAVSAEYLFADAKKRKWGLEKPWRVIHITSSSSSSSRKSGSRIEGLVTTKGEGVESEVAGKEGGEKAAEEGEKKKKRKTRPGKKRRILIRGKAKQAREHEEMAKKQVLEKELHLQEKKKRLNRERKLKRRQKEREKKAQAQGQAGGAGAGDGGSDDGLSGIE